jgi:hypothetical protein
MKSRRQARCVNASEEIWKFFSRHELPAAEVLLGDFTGDGIVNSTDLASWKSGFGTISNATLAQGDADGDHDVDGADFLAWQQQLGGGVAPPEPPSPAVPEPSSLLLLSVAAASKWRRRRSRQLT